MLMETPEQRCARLNSIVWTHETFSRAVDLQQQAAEASAEGRAERLTLSEILAPLGLGDPATVAESFSIRYGEVTRFDPGPHDPSFDYDARERSIITDPITPLDLVLNPPENFEDV